MELTHDPLQLPETWQKPGDSDHTPTAVYCCQYRCPFCEVTWRVTSPDVGTIVAAEVRCGRCDNRGEPEWFIGPNGRRWYSGEAGCHRCGEPFPTLCHYCDSLLTKDD